MKKYPIIFCILLALLSFKGYSQCNDAIPAIAQSSNYQVNSDGTVTDLLTGLIWKQCSQGLSGTGCTVGAAELMTWKQALNAAEEEQFAGRNDWRVPNIFELSSLLKMNCSNPAINANVFPNTANYIHWTSSPNAINSGFAWYIDFFDGKIQSNLKKNNNRIVRFVRGGGASRLVVNPLQVNLLSETLPDGTFIEGTNDSTYTDAVKRWHFSANQNVSGLKAVLVSTDSDLIDSTNEIWIGDISVNGTFTVELPISIKKGASEISKRVVWKLVDGSGETVQVGSSETFWVELRTNQPPRFTGTPQLVGAAGDELSLMLDRSDQEGELLTYTIIDDGGASKASFNGNTLTVQFADQNPLHTVRILVSDGRESVERDVSVVTYDREDILGFYQDVDSNHPYLDEIYFATLSGLLVGSDGYTTDERDCGAEEHAVVTSRVFKPDCVPTWSEVLAMVVGAAVDVGAVELPTDNLLKAPGFAPAWVDPYYTVARLKEGVDSTLPLTAVPTKEEIARLLVKVLGLDAAMESYPFDWSGIVFDAGVCLEEESGCFSSERALRYAQITRVHGLMMSNRSTNPQLVMNRGEITAVMSAILRMPSGELAVVDASDTAVNTVEAGDPLSVVINGLYAPVMKVGGLLVTDMNEQPHPDVHTSLTLALNGKTINEQPIYYNQLPEGVIDTADLETGEHLLVVALRNTAEDETRSFFQTRFSVTVTDRDHDGVQDQKDPWPEDSRYSVDMDGDQIPDLLEQTFTQYALDGKGLNDVVATENGDTTVQQFIDNFGPPLPPKDIDFDGYPDAVDNCPYVENQSQKDLDGDEEGDACDADMDGDGVENSSDAYPLDASKWQSDNSGGGSSAGSDTDGDGEDDSNDNCVHVANSNQADNDQDGEGDACDADMDGDGVENSSDAYPLDASKWQSDNSGGGSSAGSDTDGGGDQLSSSSVYFCSGAIASSAQQDSSVESIWYGLRPGWNLIGTPLQPKPNALEALLAVNGVESIWLYDAGWKNASKLHPEVSTLTELDMGKAYWVRYSSDASEMDWELQGNRAGVADRSNGWNMIAIADVSESIPDFLEKSNARSIWSWSNDEHGGRWESFVEGTPIFLNSLVQLKQEKGYYLYAPKPCLGSYDIGTRFILPHDQQAFLSGELVYTGLKGDELEILKIQPCLSDSSKECWRVEHAEKGSGMIRKEWIVP